MKYTPKIGDMIVHNSNRENKAIFIATEDGWDVLSFGGKFDNFVIVRPFFIKKIRTGVFSFTTKNDITNLSTKIYRNGKLIYENRT